MRFVSFGLILAASVLVGVAAPSILFEMGPLSPPDIQRDLRTFAGELPGFGFVTPSNMPVPQHSMAVVRRPDLKEPVDAYALIRASAEKHHVPAAIVKSIVAAESNFHTEAVSPKGAIGLMQLMPETAQEYGANPWIPEQNVDAGIRYFRYLMNRYQRRPNCLKSAIAAYNAGPAMVDRYRGVPPFRETRRYVVRVLNFLRQYQKEPA
jgi:soluble lytic murein transglycosylase-like protein